MGGQRKGPKYSCGPALCQNFPDVFMYDASQRSLTLCDIGIIQFSEEKMKLNEVNKLALGGMVIGSRGKT